MSEVRRSGTTFMPGEAFGMSSPAPIVIRLQTPLPVTVHGQVPIGVHSPIPVEVRNWQPPDMVALANYHLTEVAVAVALLTLIGVAYQIWLARKELHIIARKAAPTLSFKDGKDTRTVGPHRYRPSNIAGETFQFELDLYLRNEGDRAAKDALLYLWVPANYQVIVAPTIRQEFQERYFDGYGHSLWTVSVDRPIYTTPFKTREPIWLYFDDGKLGEGFTVPESVTVYWQLVCDDGTFPDPAKPAPLHVLLK
jgi:hypothetical protein